MKMKIAVIFICILFISVALPVTGLIQNNKIELVNIKFKEINTEKQYGIVLNKINDTIDQFQTENNGSGVAIYNETMYAQSFVPSLGILTRVQLFLFREGNPSDNIEITVSIKQSLYRRYIASKSINGSQISEQGEWMEFDLNYIDLIPGNIYYIVCTTSGGTKTDHFSWYFDIHNPYFGGDTQFSENYGADWFPFVLTGFPHIDFCFITYGYENFAPNKPVKPDGEIKGYYSKPYSYHTISADVDNDEMFYFWDWGDGSNSDAKNGDTVFVYDDSSPYYENIIVNKSIILIGENRGTTVIDGGGYGDVITVIKDQVNISESDQSLSTPHLSLAFTLTR